MRPIVFVIGSCLIQSCKRAVLTPLTGQYTVKNSTVFAESIRNTQITREDRLVGFDVTSLFTKVPIDEG